MNTVEPRPEPVAARDGLEELSQACVRDLARPPDGVQAVLLMVLDRQRHRQVPLAKSLMVAGSDHEGITVVVSLAVTSLQAAGPGETLNGQELASLAVRLLSLSGVSHASGGLLFVAGAGQFAHHPYA